MREPRRLLEQDATDAERALLRSAGADGPPAGAAPRMLTALEGLTAGSGGPGPGQEWGGGSAPLAAHSMKLGALAKVGLAALIGAGAVGGGALVHHLASRPAPVQAASAPAVPATPAAPTAPASEARADLREQPATVTDDSLSAELRLLDAARAALDASDPAAAEHALDGYARRFPHGRLVPEAAVLRLAVLVKRGDHATARGLAARLLGTPGYETYGPRIRSLLRETER